MNGNTILDAMEYVGDDLIDGYFRLRAKYIERKPRRSLKVRWMSLAAACLAAVILGTYGVQYIPKEYDLGYTVEDENDKMAYKSENRWIYYI